MQFHLETDELNLLANILLEEDSPEYSEIFNKVMTHDLRLDADELEAAGDLLAAKKDRLKEELARQPERKVQLERQLSLLERVLERVNEACVMF